MNTSKFQFITNEINRLKQEGLYNLIPEIESPQGAWLKIRGTNRLNLSSNNYLGLCNHPLLISRVKQLVDKYGVGPGAVRSIAGTMELHRELEAKLAEFKKVEQTLVLQSGFNANLAGIPPFLLGPEDHVFTDALNHASIIDAIRLTKATRHIYPHLDMDGLEKELKTAPNARRRVIITDGVFSMDGDIAPLDQIAELSERYDAITIIDDAHGEGVLGSHGRGIVDHFHLHGKIDVEVGTLSKAFGVVGGFLASKSFIIEYYEQKARPYLFSSALTIPDTVAALAAVEILMESDTLVKVLWDNANYFKREMASLGFDIGHSQTPITPVMLGDAKTARNFSNRLMDANVFAQAIGYPTVPKGKARIRVMISASHKKDDLDFGLNAFEEIGKELKIL